MPLIPAHLLVLSTSWKSSLSALFGKSNRVIPPMQRNNALHSFGWGTLQPILYHLYNTQSRQQNWGLWLDNLWAWSIRKMTECNL